MRDSLQIYKMLHGHQLHFSSVLLIGLTGLELYTQFSYLSTPDNNGHLEKLGWHMKSNCFKVLYGWHREESLLNCYHLKVVKPFLSPINSDLHAMVYFQEKAHIFFFLADGPSSGPWLSYCIVQNCLQMQVHSVWPTFLQQFQDVHWTGILAWEAMRSKFHANHSEDIEVHMCMKNATITLSDTECHPGDHEPRLMT